MLSSHRPLVTRIGRGGDGRGEMRVNVRRLNLRKDSPARKEATLRNFAARLRAALTL
jgi:hypothetical protein